MSSGIWKGPKPDLLCSSRLFGRCIILAGGWARTTHGMAERNGTDPPLRLGMRGGTHHFSISHLWSVFFSNWSTQPTDLYRFNVSDILWSSTICDLWDFPANYRWHNGIVTAARLSAMLRWANVEFFDFQFFLSQASTKKTQSQYPKRLFFATLSTEVWDHDTATGAGLIDHSFGISEQRAPAARCFPGLAGSASLASGSASVSPGIPMGCCTPQFDKYVLVPKGWAGQPWPELIWLIQQDQQDIWVQMDDPDLGPAAMIKDDQSISKSEGYEYGPRIQVEQVQTTMMFPSSEPQADSSAPMSNLHHPQHAETSMLMAKLCDHPWNTKMIWVIIGTSLTELKPQSSFSLEMNKRIRYIRYGRFVSFLRRI